MDEPRLSDVMARVPNSGPDRPIRSFVVSTEGLTGADRFGLWHDSFLDKRGMILEWPFRSEMEFRATVEVTPVPATATATAQCLRFDEPCYSWRLGKGAINADLNCYTLVGFERLDFTRILASPLSSEASSSQFDFREPSFFGATWNHLRQAQSESGGKNRQLTVIDIPLELFDCAGIPFDARVDKIYNPTIGADQLLIDFFQSYCRELPGLSPESAVAGLQSLVLLMGASWRTTDTRGGPGAGAIRQAILKSAQSFIRKHHADPNLTPEKVAAALRISRSRLYDIFEPSGIPVHRHILESRLAAAKRILSDPSSRSRKIADIAFECGFDVLWTFNRAFKNFYGCTPNEIREPARQKNRS